MSVVEFAPMDAEFREDVNVILERAIERAIEESNKLQENKLRRLQDEFRDTSNPSPTLLVYIIIAVAEALGETV